jgi:hypothetical protein
LKILEIVGNVNVGRIFCWFKTSNYKDALESAVART